jgi:very-short-patch-repair endonuclease
VPVGVNDRNAKLKTKKPSRRTELEDEFLRRWQFAGGPPLLREFQFDEKRRWRFDFLHALSRVAVECEGSVYAAGRHTRGKGFEEDCRKLNVAAAHGYTVFRLTRKMIVGESQVWIPLIIGTIETLVDN